MDARIKYVYVGNISGEDENASCPRNGFWEYPFRSPV